MGPLLFKAEDGSSRISGGTRASMGPLLFRAEDAHGYDHQRHRPAASMGPLLFRAEDIAALFATLFAIAASMGPLLFRAEDLFWQMHVPPVAELQWGRSCSERKTRSFEFC